MAGVFSLDASDPPPLHADSDRTSAAEAAAAAMTFMPPRYGLDGDPLLETAGEMVGQNARMRRLVIAAVLAVVLGAGLQIATDDEGDARHVAEVVPFPRPSRPLPVPEVTFVEGPWQDDVPWDAPPADADGFVARCTGTSSPPCALVLQHRSD